MFVCFSPWSLLGSLIFVLSWFSFLVRKVTGVFPLKFHKGKLLFISLEMIAHIELAGYLVWLSDYFSFYYHLERSSRLSVTLVNIRLNTVSRCLNNPRVHCDRRSLISYTSRGLIVSYFAAISSRFSFAPCLLRYPLSCPFYIFHRIAVPLTYNPLANCLLRQWYKGLRWLLLLRSLKALLSILDAWPLLRDREMNRY